MELDEKQITALVEKLSGQNISALPLSELKSAYLEMFGVGIKEDCSSCREEAVTAITSFVRKYSPPVNSNCKYRFKKEHQDKDVFLWVGTNKMRINADNLTESSADRILAHSNFCHLLEANPDYDPSKKKVVAESISPVTISTLTEAPSVESNLKQQQAKPESKPKGGKQPKVKQ